MKTVRLFLNIRDDMQYSEEIECEDTVTPTDLDNTVQEFISNYISYGWEEVCH